MGRHRQIESLLLQELTLGEERSHRALMVIQHQQTKIIKLEKDLQLEQKKLQEQLCENNNIVELEEYNRIQAEILELQESFKQITETQNGQSESENQQDCYNYAGSCHVSTSEKGIQLEPSQLPDPSVQAGDVYVAEIPGVSLQHKLTDPSQQFNEFESLQNQLEPNLRNLKDDVNNVKKSYEIHSKQEAEIRKKVDSMCHKLKWLKQERDEMVTFLSEVSEWRKRVEGILLDLSSGINENDPNKINSENVSGQKRQIWRTARKFFTTDEAHFLLTSKST